ncbi:MAG: hypothetical protein JST58_11360 [Bacteroidetes bacterium]|nr:hypothetical protein [Bacteroidota bacterium]
MTPLEILLDALRFYEIEIVSVNGNQVRAGNTFEIEVEKNGLYKLLDDGYVIAPFDDINELCRFMLG